MQVSHDVIALFFEASNREEFWLDLTSPRLYSLLLLDDQVFSNLLILLDATTTQKKQLGHVKSISYAKAHMVAYFDHPKNLIIEFYTMAHSKT